MRPTIERRRSYLKDLGLEEKLFGTQIYPEAQNVEELAPNTPI